MADRAFQTPKTQQLNLIELPVTLLGGGSGKAPVLGNGDPNAAFFNQPVFTSTGIFTIQTIDGYPQVVGVVVLPMQASAAGTLAVYEASLTAPDPTTLPDANLVTITLNTRVSGSLADIGTTDAIRLVLYVANTGTEGDV